MIVQYCTVVFARDIFRDFRVLICSFDNSLYTYFYVSTREKKDRADKYCGKGQRTDNDVQKSEEEDICTIPDFTLFLIVCLLNAAEIH
ncbi:unnamed protein product [Lasius platythorax]|uniref:Uncharacterized protein n=1 Tax=Lasius platythorax TaxID=488582 RepID=A0AAV2NDX1_9HYME